MEEDVKKWHSDCLAYHNNELYDSLIYERNIITDNLKEIELVSDKETETRFVGYFASKDKVKYLIDIPSYKKLPLKIVEFEKYRFRDDVILVPTKIQGFRIVAEHNFEFKQLIDGFANFSHSMPDMFTLFKICVVMGDIGRTYTCLVSEPNFCKSSLFKLLNSINNRSFVYQPRSVPGCLNKISGNGNIIWDDIINTPIEARKAMEDICMQVADGSPIYFNGAIKSQHTKNKYDTRLQSITFLYNNCEKYKNPDKKYFDNMFENNGALDDRFLKLFFKGTLTQTFHRDFDITSIALSNRDYYIKFAKELIYLQEYKLKGQYKRKWVNNSSLKLKGRKKLVYDELCWGIDMYCQSQEEYNKFVNLLDSAIHDYIEMLVKNNIIQQKTVIEEEIIENINRGDKKSNLKKYI